MLRKLLLVYYILIITTLSLLPSGVFDFAKAPLFEHSDKLIHFGIYAIFTFLIFYAWPNKFRGKIKQFYPLLIVIVWGSIMELLQEIMGHGRSFSYGDIIANTIGFFPGWIIWKLKYFSRFFSTN